VAAHNLVVVTSRIPGVEDRDGLFELSRALRDEAMWLGWSGAEGRGAPALVLDGSRATFDVPAPWRDHTHTELCNRVLWPLFHGFRSRVSVRSADWHGYDYQLLLAARELRRHGYRGRIGLFLHTPFPSLDLFATLPWGAELLEAVLAFDLVGFQTQQWAENFLSCVRASCRAPVAGAVVRHARGVTQVDVFPVSIDRAAFLLHREPGSEAQRLRDKIGDRGVVLAVDRLDHAMGIAERLHAFERLLERFPAWCGKVVLIQLAVAGQPDADDRELRRAIETLVGRINGRFGEADWTPIRYLCRAYDHDVLVDLYRLADVALATPLRDGMGLLAKEFVAAQDPLRPGVLVLSRFAGAAEEMYAALLTNPFYTEGFAADIDFALRMPSDDRIRRQHLLLEVLRRGGDPAAWAQRFLERLRSPAESMACRSA
jgi:trehalose-6-phosphate synthase